MTGNFTLTNAWTEITIKDDIFMQNLGHCGAEFIVSDSIPDGSIIGHFMPAGTASDLTGAGVIESNLWARSTTPGVTCILIVSNRHIT